MRGCSARGAEQDCKYGYLSRPLYREMPFRSDRDQLENRLCGDMNQKASKRVLQPSERLHQGTFCLPHLLILLLRRPEVWLGCFFERGTGYVANDIKTANSVKGNFGLSKCQIHNTAAW